MRVEIHPTHPQQRLLDKAVDVLKRGGVVVYPTDTVYGIGCDTMQKKALERVYALKRMSADHPVGLVCPDLGDIARYAIVDDMNYRIMRRLLPGPYTFILPATREVPKIVMRKQKTVGIRVPHHEVALRLVRALGHPIVSTSASIDGVQHADPEDIAAQFQHADMVLDAGWGGLEPSTIVDLTGHTPVVVREGAGPVDAV
ncbi:MAG: L-threonylcarbamoyladenylate synthase [Polyangiales bacterium]|nr:threonylcarbamoyl-AMP synthase [Sandaracinaceae bacterium]